MGEILSQITRIDNNIQNALAKVAAKGVTVSADAGSDELPGLIEQISTGVDLPELDTPGSAADLRTGKQLIDGDGNVVEGSMPTATQATPGITVSSGGLITASATQSAGYVTAGTKSATKQLTTQAAKTITPSKSTQTAVASGRYTTGAITVGAIPSQYIVPSGTKSITGNGTHDVKSYASVNVAVPTEDLNTVLTEQEALITELETVLAGKAAGGGGGSVETCTVTITTKSLGAVKEVYASQYVDGSIVQYSIPGSSNVTNLTIENIICGTVIVFSTISPIMAGSSVTHDASYINHQFGRWEFTAPTTAGVSCTIEVRDDD
jgi:hypothetical protein